MTESEYAAAKMGFGTTTPIVSLPGGNVADTPPLPGSQPQPPSTAPAWWSDRVVVAQRVLAMAEFDAKAATEIWNLYRQLVGK